MPLNMKQLLAIYPHTKLIVPTQFDIYKMMISTVNACFDLSHSILATYYIGMFITNSLTVDDYTYDRRPELAYISNMNSTYEPRRLIYAGGSLLLEMTSKIPSCLGECSDLSLYNMIEKGDHFLLLQQNYYLTLIMLMFDQDIVCLVLYDQESS